MDFARVSEDFGLHTRAHEPEWIRDDVTSNASNGRRHWVQIKVALVPAELRLAFQLDALVQREVQRVEEWRTEGRDVVASEETSDTLITVERGNVSGVVMRITVHSLKKLNFKMC